MHACHIDTDYSGVTAGGEVGGWVEVGKRGETGTERGLAWGDGHTMPGADDGLLSCAHETCMVL